MTSKKTKEEHATGVRDHSKKYGFPVKQKEKRKETIRKEILEVELFITMEKADRY